MGKNKMESIQYEHWEKDFVTTVVHIAFIESCLMMMMVSFLFYSSHKTLIIQLGTKWGATVEVHRRRWFYTNCIFKVQAQHSENRSSHSNHTLFLIECYLLLVIFDGAISYTFDIGIVHITGIIVERSVCNKYEV